ncbi:MAG: aminotransferase class I/II-fold pyridoxal phosphate-dependent enzyme [Lachnospiraceae bacterium]|nr:aminotransferase class I/II-fold pyridoxal phosphate-dependent enzyme [Lachnospiraceae bacterium]
MMCRDHERIHGGGNPDIPLDFSINVNPLGMPACCREAVIRSLDGIDRYPDTDNNRLLYELTKGYPGTHAVLGNGSAELIYALCRYMSDKRPGFSAIVTAPSFSEYEYAVKAARGNVKIVKTDEDKDFGITSEVIEELFSVLEKMSYNIDESHKTYSTPVFICNPANPTGELLERSVMARIAGHCEKNGALLVVDECFMRFSDRFGDNTMRALAKEYPNLLVLDAFTKFYAMPGLRIGYALSSDLRLIEGIRAVLQPWNVSTPAAEAALAALSDEDYAGRTRKVINKERDYLINELNTLGLRVIGNPAADFIMFEGPDGLRASLNGYGIDIRDCADMMRYHDTEPRYYRCAVRKHEDNLKLVNAVSDIVVRRYEK